MQLVCLFNFHHFSYTFPLKVNRPFSHRHFCMQIRSVRVFCLFACPLFFHNHRHVASTQSFHLHLSFYHVSYTGFVTIPLHLLIAYVVDVVSAYVLSVSERTSKLIRNFRFSAMSFFCFFFSRNVNYGNGKKELQRNSAIA